MSTPEFKVGQVWKARNGDHYCIEMIRSGRIHSGPHSWDSRGRVGVSIHRRDLVEFAFTKGPAVDTDHICDYRMLEPDDIIQPGDEGLNSLHGTWHAYTGEMIGKPASLPNSSRRKVFPQFQATPVEPIDIAPKAALDEQVGGAHYKGLKIQPVEFITANKLTFLEGCVVKRICRHRNKNGREDLEKAIHEIRLMIELEYPEKP